MIASMLVDVMLAGGLLKGDVLRTPLSKFNGTLPWWPEFLEYAKSALGLLGSSSSFRLMGAYCRADVGASQTAGLDLSPALASRMVADLGESLGELVHALKSRCGVAPAPAPRFIRPTLLGACTDSSEKLAIDTVDIADN
jgi:hypothetical protein